MNRCMNTVNEVNSDLEGEVGGNEGESAYAWYKLDTHLMCLHMQPELNLLLQQAYIF